ncbi:MAG: site-specific DNA-methyltransferase [Armatimonadetes bacterium]|nr:site-specific DNA-methyltransferase [Armatimonadota bacterium]
MPSRTSQVPLPLDVILQGDCRQVLQELPEECVDLVFADPPYYLQLGEETLLRPNLTRVDGVDDAWDSFGSFAEYDAFTAEWLRACRRVMKETATLWVIGTYHNIHRVGALLQDTGYWILNEIVWIKRNPMPNFRGVRFTNAHETLLWAKKSERQKRYTFNYQLMKELNGGTQMRSDWLIPVCRGEERLQADGRKLHSTQKPEELLRRVILSSSNPGDVVLDPFFGTGTTGAVAKRLGRHWIGIERDETYIEAARARIEAVQPEGLPDSHVVERRRLPRIPFSTLVSEGLIPPGTTLHFNRRSDITALVLPDGRVRLGDEAGSIHAMGRRAGQLPACNGWEHWYLRDPATGKMSPIDAVREAYRRRKQPGGGSA